ncbi:MAG TPA: FAD-binding oxidoreductase [Thermoleophilaceae bacterium]|nr:FAD-binding oxidoreductase [Thermoleophilaceae bacterium]
MNPAILTAETTLTDLAKLRSRIAGDVITPGDAEYDIARQAWNLAVDQTPVMVAMPESAGDVARIVRYAAEKGLRVAPQGTGHNAGPIARLDDTILMKTSRMIEVEINAEQRYARVQAGAIWADVVGPAYEHGLTAMSGSSPDVGVVGYTLGGGLSWIARKYGLATNNVRAIELVTAEGKLVRADRDSHPELFWALRGGGGSFGVVTTIEIDLFPFTEIYAGMLAFPIERASEVLNAWNDLLPSLPDEMTTVGRMLRVPPLEEIPEFLRGRELTVVEAFFLGDEAEGRRLIQPLRELGPEIDTIAMMPTKDLIHVHMDPPAPVPGDADHGMIGEHLPAAGIDTFVDAFRSDAAKPLLMGELRQLGGALARSGPDHGAADTFDGSYTMFNVGMTPTPEIAEAVAAAMPVMRKAMAPYEGGREYLNFAEQKGTDVHNFYSPETYERLRDVKTAYDPDDVIRANHPIPPKP